ncbi:hypothetical protein ACMA1I_22545 [Pontibacter sp. 13R65]|uniref:hypothetical protein n=1 Tax=Pontibacter sp. 13R65 TaxID=3127458 RepID=UPI00301C178F
MRINKAIISFIFVSFGLGTSSCSLSEATGPGESAKPLFTLEGNIFTDRTLSADTTYLLKGVVRVKAGAALHIAAGTLLRSDKQLKGLLVVEQNGKILAEGTHDKPIVFTSNAPAGQRAAGDWGGIIVCGNAPTDAGARVALGNVAHTVFGGDSRADASGVIRYVRIEFAGQPLLPSMDYPGLLLAGVGHGTTIENVMCSYSLNDGFGFRGGTVEAKRLIAFRCHDDDYDMDLGYQGRIQFGLGLKAPVWAAARSNGIEIDGTSSTATAPVLSNFTIIGPKTDTETEIAPNYENGLAVRNNGRVVMRNSIIASFPFGIFIDDQQPGAGAAALSGETQIENTVLAGVLNWGGNGYGNRHNPFRDRASDLPFQTDSGTSGSPLKWTASFPGSSGNSDNPAQVEPMVAWFEGGQHRNWQVAHSQVIGLRGNTPVPLPDATSVLLSYARWQNREDAFFDKVPFTGAFGDSDWTSGWANWDPQNMPY